MKVRSEKNKLCESGFTLIELSLVVSIFFILVGLATVNLFQFQHKSQMNATINSFVADYKEQQIKAMVGDTEGATSSANFGIHFDTTSYTLFRDTYGTSNLAVDLPSTIHIGTSYNGGAQVVFTKGSGEVGSAGTITFTDTSDSSQKVLTINKYGVITAVN